MTKIGAWNAKQDMTLTIKAGVITWFLGLTSAKIMSMVSVFGVKMDTIWLKGSVRKLIKRIKIIAKKSKTKSVLSAK